MYPYLHTEQHGVYKILDENLQGQSDTQGLKNVTFKKVPMQ